MSDSNATLEAPDLSHSNATPAAPAPALVPVQFGRGELLALCALVDSAIERAPSPEVGPAQLRGLLLARARLSAGLVHMATIGELREVLAARVREAVERFRGGK